MHGSGSVSRPLLHKLNPTARAALEYYRDAKRHRIERRRILATRLGITTTPLASGPAAPGASEAS